MANEYVKETIGMAEAPVRDLVIQCDNLVKIYKTKDIEVLALQGLDLEIERGELMAIIGNSGSGKSTFLNMIGGLDRPSAGRLIVDGKDLFKLSEREQLVLHEKRLRRILDIAVAAGEEVVILGAFGCGAFENDPQAVAMAARNVIGDYLHDFETIEFAIYCSPRDERNYGFFERAMKA